MVNTSHHRWPTIKTLRWLLFGTIVVTLLFITLGPEFYECLLEITLRWMSSPVTSEIKKCHVDTATRGQAASFVMINNTKTLLISAYLEHRTDKKEVRVITVMLRSQTVDYFCIFCCKGKQSISKGVIQIHRDHFGFPYGTADILCPLPAGCLTPSHIAVNNVIPKDEDKFAFLDIQNQEVKNDHFPYNFTVCLSTMFDFSNVLQLVQSLEMFQLLGVNRVAVYTTSYSPETRRTLEYYTNKGLLEVIPWSLSRFYNVSHSWLPQHGPGDLHYFGQIPALTDCLYRYMYRSKYVALQDIDELILPQSVNSWLELLPLLEKKYGAGRCYMFQNMVFPNNITLPPPAKQTPPPPSCWESIPGVNILAHLHQEPINPKTMYENFKIIVNPRAVFTPTVHGVLNSEKECTWVDKSIARLYHTRAQMQTGLKPDQLIYDGRLLSYSASLTPAVNSVLKESGLLPKNSFC